MDSLLQMVRSGMPGLAEQGLSPQYLIGATAAGAAALQGGSARRLEAEDMVYLRTDEHVQAWVLSCSTDPLDLLVVAERARTNVVRPSASTRRRLRRGRGGTTGESSAAGGDTRGEQSGDGGEDIPAPPPGPPPVASEEDEDEDIPAPPPSPSPVASEEDEDEDAPAPPPRPPSRKKVRRRKKRVGNS